MSRNKMSRNKMSRNRMSRNKVLVLITMLLLLGTESIAQDLKIEPGQRYLLLATRKTKTMQKELDEAASQGFRIMLASFSAAEMVLFLERVSTPPDVYTYLLLATVKAKTLEKELNEVASKGYRLIPQTLMHKQGLTIFNSESVAILEKQPKTSRRYEYKVISTGGTGKLQKEVSAAAAGGFGLLALVSFDGNVVIMEKESSVQQ